jgi:peptidoglycan/xylan/chitin deacetylase (PgdA/CDA1 family)
MGDTFIGAGGRIIYKNRPMVAITFDDGPFPQYTSVLMDLFESYESRATFFTVGYKIDNYPDTVRDAYRRGFQIGNHTLNHEYLNRITVEQAKKEIHDNQKKLRALGVRGVILLRPPYGEHNAAVDSIAGVPMIGWSVDSRDWETYNTEKTRAQIMKDVRDGYIVLCHDIIQSTVEAMQYVVPELISQGYQLVTVDELFFAKGMTLQNGVYYRYAK